MPSKVCVHYRNNIMSNIELLHVYVLRNQFQLIKIGIASNVAKRIKNIQANSGVPTRHKLRKPRINTLPL
ncbi:hypothetical protein THIOM_005453 [Candidatus Thiomargarita nelsonii]|uniref:Bacteriophage T5 Orf172 DNA-binding domain-containing protein n=1 Tax=Candidatus Thiomargarita nelsonii TaxID=1003181 RepID=A0A176RT87_9GAMM|nr:hypothetical protein THIOM_005453 [Candidatus Thiomargarita nelsonii]